MAAKNILIFADGTGDEGGLLPDAVATNVYKLYRATRIDPLTDIDPKRQIAFYVSGIGTPEPGKQPKKVRQAIQDAVGWGLSRKIVQCYMAIISAWRPGDRIYLFGFSRGAYTVRCVAHMLEQLGIPTRQANNTPISLDPKDLYPIAVEGRKILYRLGLPTADNAKRDDAFQAFRTKYGSVVGADQGASAYFIGVWDTVAAEGMARIFEGREDKHLPKSVMFIRHAMSIDEYRKDFARVPWGSARTMREPVQGEPFPFEQVWFAGNHDDIGGSSPENESRLSDITLDWMVRFISEELPEHARVQIDDRYLNLHPDCAGQMHDECMGGIYGTGIPWDKKIRPVAAEGKLHQSVLDRLALPEVRNFSSYGPYRPKNLEGHPAAKRFFEKSPQAPLKS